MIWIHSIQLNHCCWYSARQRSLDALEVLLDFPGCIVNSKNNNGDTPLHLAVTIDDEELQELDDEDAARLEVADMLLEVMMEQKVNIG
jgi:ankyrin repeat protein